MTQPTIEPNIGDKMPDGTVCAGISPDTGKAMYTTPADAPLTYTFNEALAYAYAKGVTNGHQDWHLPTRKELDVLFNNRAALDGFYVAVSDPVAPRGFHPLAWLKSQFGNASPKPSSLYWSSDAFEDRPDEGTWALDSSNGVFYAAVNSGHLSVRLVRSTPKLQ